MAKVLMNIYDSDLRAGGVKSTFFALWKYRDVIKVLVRRDLTVRYKRSILGLLWTLLNPLLTSLVLWFVFIAIFSARLPDGTQFAPYVLSGVLMVTFFIQGFNQSADAIANGSTLLSKVFVPPQVFAFAGAISNAVNFILGLFALSFICILTGNGVSVLAPLTLVPIICMLMYVTGLGLFISISYIRFDDTRNIVAVVVSFMMYLSPIFYPKEILNEKVLLIVNANPLTSYLDVFRYVFTNTGVATTSDWAYMTLSSIFFFLVGIRAFAKAWPRTVVML